MAEGKILERTYGLPRLTPTATFTSLATFYLFIFQFFNVWNIKKNPKPHLLEELLIARFVPVSELDFGLLAGLAFQSTISDDMLSDYSFDHRNIHKVPRGQERIGHLISW